MDVVLTTQSLLCRYQDAFQNSQPQACKPIQKSLQNFPNQRWQIIIKVAVQKNIKSRTGFAYEAKSMEGAALFTGGVSKGRQNPSLVLLDVVGEAILKAKELGYYKVIILSHSKRFVQICNGARKPTWQELTLITDLNHLHQQGLLTLCCWVPKLVLARVLDLAFITTCFPVHLCRIIPNPL